MSGDYSPFGRRRDHAVCVTLGDIALQASGSPYLVTPGCVTKDDSPYQVFTPYFGAGANTASAHPLPQTGRRYVG